MILCNTRILGSPLTGMPRYTRELLDRMGHAVTPVAPSRPLSGARGHLWEQSVLPGLARGALLWSPATTGPLAVRRQVVTVHDVVPLDHPEWLGGNFARWYRFLLPRLLPRVAHVVTVSQYSRMRILEHTRIAEERVSVIPNGVDARFAPQPAERIAATVRDLALPSPHYVLSVGSLEPRKNLPGLLKAWDAVHRRLPDDVWLVLTGRKGPAQVFGRFELDRLPPRVHLTGHVPDGHLPSLMAGALAFAYLSFYEGFGLPPLEAMACGTPCVTSDRTSIPEVVGDAALTVPPENTDAIADALTRVVEDSALRTALSARGRERAAAFTWDAAAAQTLEILRGTEGCLSSPASVTPSPPSHTTPPRPDRRGGCCARGG